MRISDWSSDVCSSDLEAGVGALAEGQTLEVGEHRAVLVGDVADLVDLAVGQVEGDELRIAGNRIGEGTAGQADSVQRAAGRRVVGGPVVLAVGFVQVHAREDWVSSEERLVGKELVCKCDL